MYVCVCWYMLVLIVLTAQILNQHTDTIIVVIAVVAMCPQRISAPAQTESRPRMVKPACGRGVVLGCAFCREDPAQTWCEESCFRQAPGC